MCMVKTVLVLIFCVEIVAQMNILFYLEMLFLCGLSLQSSIVIFLFSILFSDLYKKKLRNYTMRILYKLAVDIINIPSF
jgi:hypothetical protein